MPEAELGIGFVPLLFQIPAVLWSILFYIFIELAFRQVANYFYPLKPSSSPQEDLSLANKRETIGRYTPSWIHAFLCGLLFFLLQFSTRWGLDQRLLEMWMMGQTFGYFIGDMLVDQDSAYFLHHIAPLIHGEILLRAGAFEYFFSPTGTVASNLYHASRCLGIIELGNLVSHTAAILTFRTGHIYHFFLASSMWISRPASVYYGFSSWSSDLSEATRYSTVGLVLLASITLTYLVNLRWMHMMVMAFFFPAEKKRLISLQTTSHHSNHHSHLRQD